MRTLFTFMTLWLVFGDATTASAHSGFPNMAAREVCADSALGDACEWRDAHRARYIGTCRRVSETLLCVRHRPIDRSDVLRDHDHDTAHDAEHGHGHEHGDVHAAPGETTEAGAAWPLGIAFVGLGGFAWTRRRCGEDRP